MSNLIALNQSLVQSPILEIVPKQVSSFTQDQKHETKSDRFVTIQPSQIAAVLADYGLHLAHLKTGHARKAGNEAHQTTIARYRSNTELKIGGLNLDLVFKVPHLYGTLQAFLGTYRQVCSNGLVVGTKYFEAPRIRHSGNALSQLEALIPKLVGMHDQLGERIAEMTARNVTPSQVAEFVRESAKLRLGDSDNIVNVQFTDLTRVRRQEDVGENAFTVLNRVEENFSKHGLRYQSISTYDKGIVTVRNMKARPLLARGETNNSVDFGASIWDLADQILMVG